MALGAREEGLFVRAGGLPLPLETQEGKMSSDYINEVVVD